MKHFDFGIDWDRDYGVDRKGGWSITINGVVYVEFARTLIGALIASLWRWAQAARDMARERRWYAREAKARAAR